MPARSTTLSQSRRRAWQMWAAVPRTLLISTVLACVGTHASAQTSDSESRTSAPRIQAVRTTASIQVDGRLDETAWAAAPVATDFVQREPSPGAPASLRTEARVLVDGTSVYVGMRMHDPHPDSIGARLVRRDDPGSGSDWAHVWIDSYHDRRTAFHFATTPRASRMDVLHYDDTGTDVNWDAVWDVSTAIDAEGWSAEFRIPLSQLRFSGEGNGEWGIQFGREIARRSEVSYWVEWPPNAPGMVSLFGTIGGFDELRVPRNVEVIPYTLSRLTRAPGDRENPFYARNDLTGAVGADIKLGVTSNLTLTATVNPDFGQVEADPSVVNLTGFETLFPEKRTFFNEGSDIFSFPLSAGGYVFYSRRIGRAPQRRTAAPEGGYVDQPEAARIIAAAKLSGKTAGGWSVGMLTAVTEQAMARTVDSLGVMTAEPVEPSTIHSVTRVMRDFRRGRSAVGAILTTVNRRLDDPRLNGIPSNGYVGGLNARHRFGTGHIEAAGWLLGTHVAGSNEAMLATQTNAVHLMQRPDARHLTVDSSATSLTGWAGEARVAKVGGGSWAWNVTAGARSPDVDTNDLGFMSFTDTWYATAAVSYNEVRSSYLLREWSTSFVNVNAQTFGNEPVARELYLNGNAQLHSNGSIGVNLWYYGSVLSPWALRGGPALRIPSMAGTQIALSTDQRRSTVLGLSAFTQQAADNGAAVGISPSLILRPSDRAVVSLSPQFSRNYQPAQYVSTPTTSGSPRYVMAALEQRTLSFVTRLTWLFGPEVSLELYTQPFISAGQYSHFKRVADPVARDFEQRFASYSPGQIQYDSESRRFSVDEDNDGTREFTFRNPTFSVRELNTNAVVRWEYRSGSTLCAIWSHARADHAMEPGLRIRRDAERLFSAPAMHVLVLKLSYWLGV